MKMELSQTMESIHKRKIRTIKRKYATSGSTVYSTLHVMHQSMLFFNGWLKK